MAQAGKPCDWRIHENGLLSVVTKWYGSLFRTRRDCSVGESFNPILMWYAQNSFVNLI